MSKSILSFRSISIKNDLSHFWNSKSWRSRPFYSNWTRLTCSAGERLRSNGPMLSKSQVLELLGAFSNVRPLSFHLVKTNPAAVTSMGYCFLEYVDENITQIAAMALNVMEMGGGKVLSAKLASQKVGGEGVVPPPSANLGDGVNVDTLLNAALVTGPDMRGMMGATTVVLSLIDENHNVNKHESARGQK